MPHSASGDIMTKQAKRAGIVLAAVALSGCALGIGSGRAALSGSFEAPVPYKQAYQSAVDQAKLCLLGDDAAYRVDGRLDESARSGSFRIVSRMIDSQEAARVEVSADGDARVKVHVEMWGKSIWDVKAMRAMHDAVYFNTPSCTAYMPGQTGVDPDAWFSGKK
jgi:hypothetical protein